MLKTKMFARCSTTLSALLLGLSAQTIQAAPQALPGYHTITDADRVYFGVRFLSNVNTDFDENDLQLTGSLAGSASLELRRINNYECTVWVTLGDPNTDGTIGVSSGSDYTYQNGDPGEAFTFGTITIDNTLQTRNLLSNSSFETTTANVPDGWEVIPGPVGSTKWDYNYVTGDSTAFDGDSYVRSTTVNESGSDGLGGWTFTLDNLELEQNARYRIWIRARGGWAKGVYLQVNGSVQTGPGTALEEFFDDLLFPAYPSAIPIEKNEWIEHSDTFTTSANRQFTSYTRRILLRFGNSSLNDSIDYDSIIITLEEKLAESTLFIGSGSTGLPFDFGNGVIMEFDSLSGTLQFITERGPGLPADFTVGTGVDDHWWTLTEPASGTFSAVLTFEYEEQAVADAGLAEADLKLYRNDGSGWVEVPSTVDTDANTITTNSPVSSFSDWAIGGAQQGPTNAPNWQLWQ